MIKKLVATCLTLLILLSTNIGWAKDYTLTFHAGAVGGLYMEPSVAWADQLMAAIPGLKISCIVGGAATNPIIVARGNPNEVLGMTDPITGMDAANGTGEYAKRLPGGTKALRALWRINVTSWTHILARPDVVPEGVTTLGQLLEKNPKLRVLSKPRGTGDEILVQRLFESYGYSYDDLKAKGMSITFNSPSDMGTLMIDGHADVAISTARTPAAYILDMESSIADMRWLALDKLNAEKLRDKYGYIMGFQPAGSYASLKHDNLSVAIDHIVIVNENMDEELAYQITKVVMSNPDKVRAAVPAFKTFDVKVAGQATVLPLHKGAIRAYEELGLPYDK
jgi:TRAP transporter TAXI family solute receptor